LQSQEIELVVMRVKVDVTLFVVMQMKALSEKRKELAQTVFFIVRFHKEGGETPLRICTGKSTSLSRPDEARHRRKELIPIEAEKQKRRSGYE
jgi:hypothetical protein